MSERTCCLLSPSLTHSLYQLILLPTSIGRMGDPVCALSMLLFRVTSFVVRSSRRNERVGQGPRRNVNPSFSPDHHLRAAAAIAAPARDRALSLSITAPPDRNLTFDIDMCLRAPPAIESKRKKQDKVNLTCQLKTPNIKA